MVKTKVIHVPLNWSSPKKKDSLELVGIGGGLSDGLTPFTLYKGVQILKLSIKTQSKGCLKNRLTSKNINGQF